VCIDDSNATIAITASCTVADSRHIRRAWAWARRTRLSRRRMVVRGREEPITRSSLRCRV
jgi:hypothetical protein